jgi:hypothetical protein
MLALPPFFPIAGAAVLSYAFKSDTSGVESLSLFF